MPPKHYESQDRYVKWCITINYVQEDDDSDADESEEDFKALWSKWLTDQYEARTIVSGVFGFERGGAAGRLHVQGALTLTRRLSLANLKDLLGCNHAHCEPMKDKTGKTAYAYCKKDGDYIDVGEQPDGKPTYEQRRNMKRQATADAMELFKQGVQTDPFKDLVAFTEFAQLYMRNPKYWQEFQAAEQRKKTLEFRQLKTTVFYGATGVGKTRRAIDECKQLFPEEYPYILSAVPGQPMWYDGYTGQHCLIIDDLSLSGERGLSITEFKRLLDGHPFRIPVKGGFRMANWTHVYITTNEKPTEWYFHMPEADYKAAQRRMHVIIEIKDYEPAGPEEGGVEEISPTQLLDYYGD